MKGDPKTLKALERLARIKADRELKKFAAFSLHVSAARARVEGFQTALLQAHQAASPLSLPEARAANAQAGRTARQLIQADAELARMLPRFEVARQQASRDFGRAEVLYALARRATKPG
ncbi:hypothetical protein MLD63_11550 [Paracoccus sp. TK19116]|uniref:Uncharacterized protein n=1 Tax=Paracoccus albicereus TaxID=2922394 RepID=A0ABT1MRX4_9RHOB|nr:hypothetical protein [Paracoccus albicereus]MCQ0971057.1 hypothetical protein [Paracoccus albicereus]